jgi:hypothetical protein
MVSVIWEGLFPGFGHQAHESTLIQNAHGVRNPEFRTPETVAGSLWYRFPAIKGHPYLSTCGYRQPSAGRNS